MTVVRDWLAEHPFLRDLTPAQLDTVASCATQVTLPAGKRIFREDEAAERCWLLRSGRVALEVHLPGKDDVVLETLGAGAVLGWSWLFPPYRWHFGATATAETAAVELDTSALRAALESDPALGYVLVRRFMGVVTDRLQATRMRLLDVYQHPGAGSR